MKWVSGLLAPAIKFVPRFIDSSAMVFIPLLPVQLLWINLITDGFPALALSVDDPSPNIMKRKPRDPN